jgi:TolB-like protein/DNA-binding winged helix-turn-helix (wHTH) protein/Flp pilus assembly protein TadD
MPRQPNEFLEFAPFRIDVQERQLLRDGEAIPLTAKAFDVLLLLVRRSGETVTKDEFMSAVWAGTVVEEANLTDNISTLRQALGDDARDPRFIRTVPRRGYKFVASVRSVTNVPEAHKPQVPLSPRPEVADREPTTPPSSPAVDRPSEKGTGRRPGRALVAFAIAAVVLAALGALAYRITAAGVRPQSIAVLPFQPLLASERDPAMEMGMTDALIAKLSRIGDLSVRPTTAVLAYANDDVDVQEVADRLSVDTVVQGTLQRRGDRVRVSVQLVRAEDGTTLWADRFDERMTDIFALQDVISERVASALKVRLSQAERVALARRPTENVEAYQLYLTGLQEWRTFAEPGLQASVRYFNAALKLDPGFAEAHAGLSNSYAVMGIWGPIPAHVAFPKAQESARRALALNPDSADTHVASIVVKLLWERDWAGARKELDVVQELDPQNVGLFTMRGYYYQAMGRPDLALRELERSRDLAPDWQIAKNDLMDAYIEARQFDRAIRESTKAIALDDRPSTPHSTLGSALAATGRYEEALVPLTRILARSHTVRNKATVAWVYGRMGRRAEALALLEELKKDDHPWAAFSVARGSMGLGDHDQAFLWLNRAADQKMPFLWDVRNRFEFDPIRNDPRYAKLLARINLTP